MKCQFSVCMPSNRDFANSRRAIETSLAFCEMRGGLLIVSDNSRDPEKARHWSGASEHLIFLGDAPENSGENALNVLRAAKTPFLLPIGDDDELLFDAQKTPIDLSTLGEDYVGVKPLTEIFSDGRGTINQRAFSLEEDRPGQRLRQFWALNGGDNTAFYSFFRTEAYMALQEFFLANHPTRGVFSDWQLSMALIVQGKLAFDPSVVYRYNIEAWYSAEQIAEKARESYLAVGLPYDFEKYRLLIRAMDLFVFVGRRGALSRTDTYDVQSQEVGDMLNLAMWEVVDSPNLYPAEALDLAQKGIAERNPALKFLLAASVLDTIIPGMKGRYIAFLKAASQ